MQAGGRSIAFNRFRSEKSSRGLVVYFHGGPGRSLRDDAYLNTIRNYLDLGYEVLAVDGVGSRDNGLRAMVDLRQDGMQSILNDARVVADYVERISPSTNVVVVHGESFGGAQAIATSRQLDDASLILVTPWLKHREVNEVLDGQRQIRSQMSWEVAILGPRDAPSSIAFRQSLSKLTKDHPLPRSALVIFAAGDRISRPEDIRAGEAEVVVLQRTPHELVMGQRETWRLIARHLGLLDADRSSSASE